jgi:hypothetical protein
MRICAALLFFLIASAASASAQTLVYRVDHATAVIEGGNLVVTAKGAVRSGGWNHAKLVSCKTSAPEEICIEFVASPPGNKSAVAHSIVPVSVKLRMRPPSGAASIKVVSETNSMTTRIAPKKPRLAGK